MFTGNYLRWVFLLLLCSMVHATLPAQTFQVAGGVPYFPAYNNTAAVTLSPIPPGAVIYDKSQAQLQLYTGSAWVSLCSANVPSASNASTAFRIMKGIPVLSVANLSTTATAGATYLNTTGSVRVGDGSAWNTLAAYMNKTGVTTTNPARMGAVAGTGSALVIPVLTTAPTVTAAGAAYFDKTSANLKVYNGASWLTVSCNLPVATNVSFSGALQSYGSLTGSYTYQQADGEPEGASRYQWYFAYDDTGTGQSAIGGATSKNYTISSENAGMYIAFGVIPVSSSGLVGSMALSTWKLIQWQGCGEVLAAWHTTAKGAPTNTLIRYGTTWISRTNSCWITKNLGASTQASGPYDATDQAAGWYWQYGMRNGLDSQGNPSSSWSAGAPPYGGWTSANDPCTNLLGAGWHIPSYYTFNQLDKPFYGVSGAYNCGIYLHGAGAMKSRGSISYRGDSGYYWLSDRRSGNGNGYYEFMSPKPTNYFNGNNNASVYWGETIRCTK